MHIDDEYGERWPDRQQLAQQPLKRRRLAVGVDAKFDEHEPRAGLRLREFELAFDAMLEERRTRRGQSAVVVADVVGTTTMISVCTSELSRFENDCDDLGAIYASTL